MLSAGLRITPHDLGSAVEDGCQELNAAHNIRRAENAMRLRFHCADDNTAILRDQIVLFTAQDSHCDIALRVGQAKTFKRTKPQRTIE